MTSSSMLSLSCDQHSHLYHFTTIHNSSLVVKYQSKAHFGISQEIVMLLFTYFFSNTIYSFFFISREIFNIGHSDCVFMMQFYVIMTSSNYIKTSLSSFEQLTDLLLSTSMKIGWQQWIRFSVNK